MTPKDIAAQLADLREKLCERQLFEEAASLRDIEAKLRGTFPWRLDDVDSDPRKQDWWLTSGGELSGHHIRIAMATEKEVLAMLTGLNRACAGDMSMRRGVSE